MRRAAYPLAAAAVLAASLLSFRTALYLKGFSAIFAYGRSFFQLRLFLVWMVIVSLLAAIPERKAARPTTRWFDAATAIGFALQLITFALYQRTYELPLLAASVAVSNGAVSTTAITHIHNQKTPLAWISTAILGHPPENGDSGFPFLATQPGWTTVCATIAFVAAVVFAAAAIARFLSACPSRLRGGWILPLGISSFAVLKAVVDGGPFQASALWYWAVFSSWTRRSPEREIAGPVNAWVIWCAVVSAGALVQGAVYFGAGGFPASIIDFMSLALVDELDDLTLITALLSLSKAIGTKSAREWTIALILTCLTVMLAALNAWYLDERAYLTETAPAGTEVRYFGDRRSLNMTARHLERKTTFAELYGETGLRPGVKSITRVGIDCDPVEPLRASFDMHVVRAEPAPLDARPPWLTDVRLERCSSTAWCTHTVEAVFAPCTPLESNHHTPLFRYLASRGYETFIVRNFRYRRTKHGAGKDRADPSPHPE